MRSLLCNNSHVRVGEKSSLIVDQRNYYVLIQFVVGSDYSIFVVFLRQIFQCLYHITYIYVSMDLWIDYCKSHNAHDLMIMITSGSNAAVLLCIAQYDLVIFLCWAKILCTGESFDQVLQYLFSFWLCKLRVIFSAT